MGTNCRCEVLTYKIAGVLFLKQHRQTETTRITGIIVNKDGIHIKPVTMCLKYLCMSIHYVNQGLILHYLKHSRIPFKMQLSLLCQCNRAGCVPLPLLNAETWYGKEMLFVTWTHLWHQLQRSLSTLHWFLKVQASLIMGKRISFWFSSNTGCVKKSNPRQAVMSATALCVRPANSITAEISRFPIGVFLTTGCDCHVYVCPVWHSIFTDNIVPVVNLYFWVNCLSTPTTKQTTRRNL